MRALTVMLAFVLGVGRHAAGELPASQASFDVASYVGYRNCQKCHDAQTQVLEKHAHFTSFRTLHRLSETKQLLKALGEKSIRRAERCVRCHYSPEPGSDGQKAASGISCESCHGPARDWILKHNDYGGPTATKDTETPLRRQQRIAQAVHSGMRHPSNVYLLARSCFTCHVVDDEEIVVAGHAAHSPQFDFVSWSQGSMRHNFYRTGGKYNAKSDVKRLRMMYVASVMAELEFSLRATAKATKRGFATTQAKLCIRSQKKLEALATATKHRAIVRATELMDGIQFRREQLAQLPKVADELSEIAFSFAAKNDGTNLQGVDAFLPSETEYR